MKKLIFAFCLMVGAATVNAQETTPTPTPPPAEPQAQTPGEPQTQIQGDQNLGRVDITASELPDAAKQSLETADYSSFEVSNAYKTTKANGEVEYTVKLKSGKDKKKITFDAAGNKIKEKGKDKDKG